MTNAQSILDIIRGNAKKRRFPTTQEIEEAKEELLHFKDNPLLVIMGHVELGSTIHERNYSEVFDDVNDVEALYNPALVTTVMTATDFDELRSKAEEIIDFYKAYIVALKFRCTEFTPWQEKLLEALRQMSENTLQIKLLPLVAKLPVFYEHSNLMAGFYKGRTDAKKTVKPYMTYEDENAVRTLTYVGKVNKPARRKHSKVTYLLEDFEKHLYEFETVDDPTVVSGMLKLFEKPVKIKCLLRTKDDIEHCFTYYACDCVEFL